MLRADCGSGDRGGACGRQAVRMRRWAVALAVCVPAMLAAALPVAAEVTAGKVAGSSGSAGGQVPVGDGDEPVLYRASGDGGPAVEDGEVVLLSSDSGGMLRILNTGFELRPLQRLFRSNEEPGVTGQGWAAPSSESVDVSGAGATDTLVYSVEGQPDRESHEFCFSTRTDCQFVEVHVDEDTGLLYLGIDVRGSGTYSVTAHVEDFGTQPVEFAVSKSATGQKVYRELMVRPSSRVPDCGDYTAGTPELFGCLMLGEYLPDNPPATTTAMREALPDQLVQPTEDYSLVFSEEFDSSTRTTSPMGCTSGLASIVEYFSAGRDPCLNKDTNDVLCMDVENGYFYMTKTRACGSSTATNGNVHFKYGYWEIKYEIDRLWLPGYLNHSVLAGLRNLLTNHHHSFGISVEDEEDLLNYEEHELDLVEYIPSAIPFKDVSHEYYNVRLGLEGHSKLRTTRTLEFCSTNTAVLIINPPDCATSTKTFVVTRGVEWTPKGFIHYFKVEDDPNYGTTLTAFKISDSEASYGTAFAYGFYVCGTDRDHYFQPLDPDSSAADPVALAQAGVSHVPLPLSMVTHGSTPPTTVVQKFRVHYIRIFQPENRYSDIEPVYPPLPSSVERVTPTYACRPITT